MVSGVVVEGETDETRRWEEDVGIEATSGRLVDPICRWVHKGNPGFRQKRASGARDMDLARTTVNDQLGGAGG